jgi:hypothetical protein
MAQTIDGLTAQLDRARPQLDRARALEASETSRQAIGR